MQVPLSWEAYNPLHPGGTRPALRGYSYRGKKIGKYETPLSKVSYSLIPAPKKTILQVYILILFYPVADVYHSFR